MRCRRFKWEKYLNQGQITINIELLAKDVMLEASKGEAEASGVAGQSKEDSPDARLTFQSFLP